MKKGLLIAFIPTLFACKADIPDLGDLSVIFPGPTELIVEKSGETSALLEWKDNSEGETGFVVERKKQSDETSVRKVTLPANTTQYTDAGLEYGTYEYTVYAFYKLRNSDTAEQIYIHEEGSSGQHLNQPRISISGSQYSYLNIYPVYTLTDDGGAPCATGICWSKQPNPTVDDEKITWADKISSGTSCAVSTNQTDPSATYYLRAFATNDDYTAYSDQITVATAAAPAGISLAWTPMASVNSSMPEEIKVYETSSTLNGRKFKACYAIADMSSGNIELKTVYASTTKTLTGHIAANPEETFYVMTNGGYFTTGSSYSMIIDRGVKYAGNITTLTRGNYTYPVTRGYFGVTKEQVPFVKWSYNDYAYDRPSPNIEGMLPQKSPSSTFPGAASTLGAYTAIGGAPILMKDGKIVFDFITNSAGKYLTNYELLQTDIFTATVRPPRTLIGSTANQQIILFVCDGRQASLSDGATLLEAVQIMKSLGCVNVLNLDGGGSTAMIAGNQLLNSPSDGSQRAVISAVAFAKKK